MTGAEKIIDRLAEARAEQGLTLRKLAVKLGYGHSTVQHWEKETRWSIGRRPWG